MKNTQLTNMIKHFGKGFSLSALTCTTRYGVSGSAFHRRLADLRNQGWPIDFGHWVEHGGKRYKKYQMDLTKLTDNQKEKLNTI